MAEESNSKETLNNRNKTTGAAEKNRNVFVLIFRWLVLFVSAILCITGSRFGISGYAIIESLAVAALYNGVVTAYYLKRNVKTISLVQYLDIFCLMLLIFFSGGIESELYVILFFIIGYCGISNAMSDTAKTVLAGILLYTGTCLLSSRYHAEEIKTVTLIVRDLLFLMAAAAISRINVEVRRYDELRKKEFKIARTDKLTGLANRHYFDQKLRDEVDYAISKGSVVNILMFDLDNFKGFNDTYGHVSGDKLLILFSDIIRQSVRKTDIPVRYGGEEFVILIRDLDIIIAKSVGERIRRQLEKQRIYLGQQEERHKVTVSCGVAQFPTHSENIREVIEKADQALYRAKQLGKNIVVSYDDIPKDRTTLERKIL